MEIICTSGESIIINRHVIIKIRSIREDEVILAIQLPKDVMLRVSVPETEKED